MFSLVPVCAVSACCLVKEGLLVASTYGVIVQSQVIWGSQSYSHNLLQTCLRLGSRNPGLLTWKCFNFVQLETLTFSIVHTVSKRMVGLRLKCHSCV